MTKYNKILSWVLLSFLLLAIYFSIAYYNQKDKEWLYIEATYLDPKSNKDINLSESPKEFSYCLTSIDAKKLHQSYLIHENYHVMPIRQMTTLESVFYFCSL